jgi:hypothetical protein
MSGFNSLNEGLRTGLLLGQAIRQGKLDEEEQRRRERMEARQDALLQMQNPGLIISEKTPATGDRPEALKTSIVAPGTESDNVKPLGGGLLMNLSERDRADAAIAEREKRQFLARLEAQHEVEKKYRKGTYDASTGMEIVETDQGLQYRPITPVGSQGEPLKGAFDRESERRANESKEEFEKRKLLAQADRDFQAIENQKNREATRSLADIKREKTPVKMSVSDEHLISTLSQANAKKISIANQIEQGFNTLSNPKTDETTKIAIGRQLLKTLNSTEGADAVGAEESKRLGSLLEFNLFSPYDALSGQGAMFGRDLKGFTEQVGESMRNVRGAVKANEKIISDIESKYGGGAVKESPSTGSTSSDDDPLDYFKKK